MTWDIFTVSFISASIAFLTAGYIYSGFHFSHRDLDSPPPLKNSGIS